jgi:DNA repair protein RAD5
MSPTSSPAASATKRDSEPDLFFPASDEEDADDEIQVDHAPSSSRRSSPPVVPSSKPSAGVNADTPLFMASQESDIVALDPVPKLERTSSLTVPSTAGPSRKRPTPSRTPSSAVPAGFTGGYLGEFVCEGWSLSKGKGYCSAGSRIVFERPKAAKGADEDKRLAERNDKKLGPAKLVNGKMVHAKGKPAGKQMTIGSMLKKSSPAPTTAKKTEKKQVDQIIRFRNDRGFEVGRLSVNEAGFLVHLLDTDISEFDIVRAWPNRELTGSLAGRYRD